MKKQLCIIITVLLSMVGVRSFAYDYDIAVKSDDGITIYYNYINDGTELEVTYRSGIYYAGAVNIPAQVTYMDRTRNVTRIGSGAFYDCTFLTNVTIPSSVKSIGSGAFKNCTSLTSLTIPSSVTIIGNNAFEGCTGLTSMILPPGLMSIESKTFYGCSGLTSVTIPESVTSIGEYSFYRCYKLTNVAIPNGVTSIGSSVFYGCSGLMSVNIPESVASIGFEAFYGCSKLTNVNIPLGVTSIGESSFKNCYGLTNVTIPSSVTNIDNTAFQGCSSLTSIDIPEGVANIGVDVFYQCNKLTNVTIPSTVTYIGPGAFYNRSLTTIISRITEPFPISDETFHQDTYMNASLYIPLGSQEKYKSAEGWKKFVFIEEGSGGEQPEILICEEPTISYRNGNLSFDCNTDGVDYVAYITDSDIKTYQGSSINLSVTYNISVYAIKPGYANSEIATATLCWIDVEPQTEGITNAVASVNATPVLIQSDNGRIYITGANDGTQVAVYDVSGRQVGSAITYQNEANIFTHFHPGDIAIVKIGDRSIKVVMR